jgi:citrate synthase
VPGLLSAKMRAGFDDASGVLDTALLLQDAGVDYLTVHPRRRVDFYTGVIYRAMGFPTRKFTVLFALGRLPGWIAHWRELQEEPNKIGRPRQIYTGSGERDYLALGGR